VYDNVSAKDQRVRVPCIQHSFVAGAIEESGGGLIPSKIRGELIFGSYGLLLLGDQVKVIVEHALSKVPTDAENLAIIQLVAKKIGERVWGGPVDVRFWRRSKNCITNFDFKGREVRSLLGEFSP